jgi:glycosyltransferase A (GT-A) superfamily protein (DUF2064 family)
MRTGSHRSLKSLAKSVQASIRVGGKVADSAELDAEDSPVVHEDDMMAARANTPDEPILMLAEARQALQALEEVDVVLGPSDDGGYVLIGARTHVAGMLADVSWGTDQALADTLLALERKGLTCSQLSPRWDVDEPGDWRRFTRQFPDYNRSR